MLKSMISTAGDNASLAGGTISGDLTITGDLKVEGGGSFTYDEIVEGNMEILNKTTSSSSQGGQLRLTSNDGAVMASGHRLGVLEFGGAEDTSSTITVGARIEAVTDNTWSASENGAYLSFYTTDGDASQSEKMRITADGLVGIGVTPTYKLDIIHSSDPMFRVGASGSKYVAIRDDVLQFTGMTGNGMRIRTSDSSLLKLGTNNADRLILDNNSRVFPSTRDLGTSNTAFGKYALDNDEAGSNFNTAFGETAMGAGTLNDATYNTAVGFTALESLTT